jgi:hypothetical protein
MLMISASSSKLSQRPSIKPSRSTQWLETTSIQTGSSCIRVRRASPSTSLVCTVDEQTIRIRVDRGIGWRSISAVGQRIVSPSQHIGSLRGQFCWATVGAAARRVLYPRIQLAFRQSGSEIRCRFGQWDVSGEWPALDGTTRGSLLARRSRRDGPAGRTTHT